MKTTLDLEQRLWAIDHLGALPCSMDLLKAVDPLIGSLAPTEAEVTTEGIDFRADGDVLYWNKEVEAEKLPPVEFEFPEIVINAMKVFFEKRSFEDPTPLTLKMFEVFSL